MQCFVQGLRQELKEHVILKLPNSYAEAVDAARLKNSLTRPKLPVPNDSASRLPAAVVQGYINLPSSTQGNNNIQAHEFRTNTSFPPDSSYVTRQEFLNLQNQLSRLSQSNRASSFDSNLPQLADLYSFSSLILKSNIDQELPIVMQMDYLAGYIQVLTPWLPQNL